MFAGARHGSLVGDGVEGVVDVAGVEDVVATVAGVVEGDVAGVVATVEGVVDESSEPQAGNASASPSTSMGTSRRRVMRS